MNLSQICLAVGISALTFWTAPLEAHSWYDVRCCSGVDCQRVAGDHITATPDGYLIELPPGAHKMAPSGAAMLIPYGGREPGFLDGGTEILPSQDGDFHLCIVWGQARCFYVPMGV